MKHGSAAIGFLFIFCFSSAQIPKVSSGTIKRFEHFSSKYVIPRNIDVWLPAGYTPSKKYAVLYMQDGGSLFDSSIVWNHQEWGVDEVMGRLLSEHKVRDCIVVGIWNTGITRHNEYLPQKPFEALSAAEKDTVLKAKRAGGQDVFREYDIRSDHYLRFIVEELKPFIDSSFSTLTNRAHTFIAGSSMGGLISIYAICEYPGVFGGAACLSTHWTGIFRSYNNPFPGKMLTYLSTHLPSPAQHRIYFDHGTATLDSMYAPFQAAVDVLMKARGYTAVNYISKIFPGADHSERSWNSRLEIPIVFLLHRR
jgi:predicted alpha/beta superfamily hydrolase